MITTMGLPARHAGLDRLEAAQCGLDLLGEGCVQHGHANVVHAVRHLRVCISGNQVNRGVSKTDKNVSCFGLS